MFCLTFILLDPPTRTPAIYRCPAVEAESKFFPSVVEEGCFDAFCIEPKAGPNARMLTKGLKTFSPQAIDTRANIRWRNATIDFANGKISPKDWVARTKNLGETIHFLSYPKAPSLREATGQESGRAVFAELFVLSLPGRPCFTADDTGRTRYLPEPGRLQSWFLSMNDYLGPMLYGRYENQYLVTAKPIVLRADAKPGLFVFRMVGPRSSRTFYLNNGPSPIELPKINMDNVGGVNRGLNLDAPKPTLLPNGYISIQQ